MTHRIRRCVLPKRLRAEEYLKEARELFTFSMKGTPLQTDFSMLRAARAKARKALLLDPSNYQAVLLLAHILADCDDRASSEEALRYYDVAVSLHPEDPEPCDGKASVLLFDLDRPAEAEHFARQAISRALRQRDADSLEMTYTTLIAALMEQGKSAEARRALREAERRCPTESMRDLVANTLKELPAES